MSNKLAVAAFLALIVNRLTEALVVPIFDRYNWDKFWVMYAAWGVSAVLVALTTINIFDFIAWRFEIIGYVLTAVVAGGGANFLHDLFDGFLTITDSFEELLKRSAE